MSREYREWSPLEQVTSRIPHLGRHGRGQHIRSVASSGEFLALGTSCGSVFWYSRREDTLQRLECWPRAEVTCLELVETVDCMLGVGSSEGDVLIYQIPRPVHTSDHAAGVSFPGTVQSVQQFSVSGLHQHKISALKWSLNGEKLFTGDISGRLTCHVVDFFLQSVSSRVLSSEQSEILSLDYQSHTLLVSTLTSTFAYKLTAAAAEIVKIGEKTRSAGVFSSCFLQTEVGKSGLKCVVVRPNSRLWIADAAGVVEKTVILRESLKKSRHQMTILNPSHLASSEDDCFLHVSVVSSDDQIVVVWNQSSLHLVSLITGEVISSCNSLRSVLDLTVTSSGEIFVLETGRSVLRLAAEEDDLTPVTDWRTRGVTTSQAPDSDLESTLDNIGALLTKNIPHLKSSFDSIKSKLSIATNFDNKNKNISNRSPSPDVFDALLGVNYQQQSNHVSPSLERQSFDQDFKNKMDEIGESDFDSTVCVVRKPPKKSPKPKAKHEKKVDCNAAIDDSDTEQQENVPVNDNETALTSQEKEEALMKLLKLDESTTASTEVKDSSLESSSMGYGPPSDNSSLVPSNMATPSILSRERIIEEEETIDNNDRDDDIVIQLNNKDLEMVTEAEVMEDGWRMYDLPGQSGSLSQNSQCLIFCDNRENVFYSSNETSERKLTWRRAGFSASSVSSSASGDIVWRVHRHTAYSLLAGHDLVWSAAGQPGQWHRLCENVAGVEVSHHSGWIVKLDGGLVHHTNISHLSPHSPHPTQIYTGHFLSAVREVRGHLLAKTIPDSQLWTCPVDKLSEETSWNVVQCPASAVSVFDVGAEDELWVGDSQSRVHVSKNWFPPAKNNHILWSRVSVQNMNDNSVPAGVLPPALCKPVLCSNQRGLWVAPTMSSRLMRHSYPMTVYQWSRQLRKLSIRSVYAGGRDAYAGDIVLHTTEGQLLLGNPLTESLTKLTVPHNEDIKCLSVVPGYIWLLSSAGNIFIMNTSQQRWQRLHLGQLSGVRLVSVSVASPGVVWAVDDEGGVHMRLGPLDPPPDHHAAPAWLQVNTEGTSDKIQTVVCSSTGDKVWIMDCSNNVYVREGVFPDDHPVGTGWVAVTGVSVQSISMSREQVWAVSSSGQVYRRQGVTSTDWLGESWSRVSGHGSVVQVSCGQCDTVWTLNSSAHLHQLSLLEVGAEENNGDVTEEDWTVLK